MHVSLPTWSSSITRSDRSETAKTVVWRSILAAILAILVWIPLHHDLDALVSPDEPLWVVRSANFYEALTSGNFENTAQAAHPGVTTMWLGTIALFIGDRDAPDRMGDQITDEEIRERLTAGGDLPIDTLVMMRQVVVFANAILIAVLFLALAPLVGNLAGFSASLLLAWNPLVIGFSRLLHLDALSSLLVVIAIVAWVGWLLRHRWPLLVLTGVATGLAVVTRSANAWLPLAIVGLAVVAVLLQEGSGTSRSRIKEVLAVGLISIVTVVAIWPALWVAPVDALNLVIEGGSDLASSAHQRAILFRGDVILTDPGAIYYPIVFWLRMGPVTLIGLALLIVGLAVPAVRSLISMPRLLIFGLVAAALGNVLIISVADKKLDRYLLPSLVAMELLASLTIVLVLIGLAGKHEQTRKPVVALAFGGITLLICIQAAVALSVRPFFITWVSPLAGGQNQSRVSLGWGEGGKEIADAVLSDPELATANISGGAWPNSISWYLPNDLRPANYDLNADGAAWFLATDFLVVTEPEVSRQFYDPAMIAWFDSLEPVSTVVVDGETYARIFDLRGKSVPDVYFNEESRAFSWADDTIRLVSSRFFPEVAPGTEQRLRLTFEVTNAPIYYWLDVLVLDVNDEVIATFSRRMRSEETGPVVLSEVNDILIPPDTALGRASIRVRLRVDETGEVLSATNLATGRISSEPVIGWFEIIAEPPLTEATPEA